MFDISLYVYLWGYIYIYHVMSCHDMPCHVMARHVSSCHFVPSQATSCHVMS